ncbi:hypothetical protein BS17DRAFT_820805 [Gyrodon lividus]|nr:hypothetical protein BS17DRAFT_820805 [Gyrodon lividus]
MDVDSIRLTPVKQAEYVKKGLCFVCLKQGHCSTDHKNGHLPQKTSSPQPTPIKTVENSTITPSSVEKFISKLQKNNISKEPTPPQHNNVSALPDCNPPGDDKSRDDIPGSDGDRNPFDDNNECAPLPPNPMMVLTSAIFGLANITHNNPISESSQWTKYKLNFWDHPCAFQTNCAKVTFTQSYLKGMALKWFKPDLLHMKDPDLPLLWMDRYHEFLLKLQTNFSPHDPVTDAKHQLDNLSMKDRQCINKYVVEFNHITSQVQGYGECTLYHHFYSKLLDYIKDEVSHVGKPTMLSQGVMQNKLRKDGNLTSEE